MNILDELKELREAIAVAKAHAREVEAALYAKVSAEDYDAMTVVIEDDEPWDDLETHLQAVETEAKDIDTLRPALDAVAPLFDICEGVSAEVFQDEMTTIGEQRIEDLGRLHAALIRNRIVGHNRAGDIGLTELVDMIEQGAIIHCPWEMR